MPQSVHTVTLACHPDCPTGALQRIDARVVRTPAATLDITYVASGDIARLRVPARGAPRYAGRLWQHTCFEVFIRCGTAHAYHEFNFSPSGAWAAYAFERYREGAPLADPALAPQASVSLREDALELRAQLELDRLSPQHATGHLSLAVAAVIEDAEGTLAYWALRHPPGRPDFHHPDAYALDIDD